MFLHLSQDEKFIDSARDAFERAAPGLHEFVAIDAPDKLRYIRSFAPRRLSLVGLTDRAFLSRLPDYQAVLLHSLTKANRIAVDSAPKETNFVWLGWGYDYYGLMATSDDLLLPMTRALAHQLRRSASTSSIIDLAKVVLSPRRLRAGLRARKIRSGGPDEHRLLQKIAYFAPVLPAEDTLLRLRHPDFRPSFVSWNYGVHHLLDQLPSAIGSLRAHRVVVGNSATPECNHLDAFDWLADSGFNGDVVCPLSYGSAKYRDSILRAGESRFGRHFTPLTEYMPANEYATLIATSSHLIMNHLRQQGLTNILIALKAGTRVIMQRANPLFSHLVELGLQPDDIAGDLETAPLPDAVIAKHRRTISDEFGAVRHHQRTCELLSQIAMSPENLA